MITYKITANGVTQYTSTGKELYCSILDKFNIEYEVIRQNHIDKNDNDIPHSDIRRMESEGVYEEKFSEENSSTTHMGNWCHPTVTEDVSVKYVYEPNKPL